MTWFWLALAAQFLFAVGTHVDKFLLSRYLKGAAPGSLILFSAVFGFVVMPVAYAVAPDVLAISLSHVGILVAGGFLNITAIVLYLYALSRDEASVVAPLFQMIPIFGYVLAFLILGETVSLRQAAGAGLIIAGAVLVSLDLDARKFKGVVFALMAVASLFLATNVVVFKRVALEDSFWVSTFWSYASLALAGVLLISFVPSYRAQFLRTLSVNRATVIVVNSLNEIIAVVGYVMISYASLLAPVALVSVVGGFGPLMVFLLGWLLTAAFPRLGRERLSRRQVVQKSVAVALVLIGTVLLHAGA